jgi:cephalosporin hydroxylase
VTFDEAWHEIHDVRKLNLPHDKAELRWLFEHVQASGAQALVEIGSRYGSGLFILTQALPPGSTVVSVDLPGGPHGRRGSLEVLRGMIGELNADGYHAHLIVGDSHAPAIVAEVEASTPNRPCAVFIDGDHSYEGVRSDWLAYHALPGLRLVMFHDTCGRLARSPVEVPRLFGELGEAGYRTESYVDTGEYGVGVVHMG